MLYPISTVMENRQREEEREREREREQKRGARPNPNRALASKSETLTAMPFADVVSLHVLYFDARRILYVIRGRG